MVFNKSVLIPFFLVLSLCACKEDFNVGGGGEGDFNLGGGTGGNFNGGGSDGGSQLTGVIPQQLNCRDLDPDKVYMFGLLRSENSAGKYGFGGLGLAVPENTSAFCAAFAASSEWYDMDATITSSGNIFYSNLYGNGIYRMMPDDVTVDSNSNWFYPGSSSFIQNDDWVSSVRSAPYNVVKQMVTNPSNDQVFFRTGSETDAGYVGHEIYSSPQNDVYYENPLHSDLLAALDDGTLVLFSIFRGVILLSPTLEETDLIPPFSPAEDDRFEYPGVAKRAPDGTLWFAASLESNKDNIFRWKIDLSDNSIINEGAFAPLPDDVVSTYGANQVFDGNGDLWQLAVKVNDPTTNFDDESLVIKRPMLASGGSTQIIYNRDTTPDLGIKIIPYRLYTGP